MARLWNTGDWPQLMQEKDLEGVVAWICLNYQQREFRRVSESQSNRLSDSSQSLARYLARSRFRDRLVAHYYEQPYPDRPNEADEQIYGIFDDFMWGRLEPGQHMWTWLLDLYHAADEAKHQAMRVMFGLNTERFLHFAREEMDRFPEDYVVAMFWCRALLANAKEQSREPDFAAWNRVFEGRYHCDAMPVLFMRLWFSTYGIQSVWIGLREVGNFISLRRRLRMESIRRLIATL